MPLVDYSDDDDEPLKLPAERQRTFQHGPRLRDPGFHPHQRAIDHRDGFWPCHVFLDFFPNAAQTAELETISSAINFECLATTDLGAARPLHISLSETLMIAQAEKQDFLHALRSWAAKVSLGPVEMASRIGFLPNPTGERLFATISPAQGEVSTVIESLNKVLASLGWDLPLLSPEFPHMSIAAAGPERIPPGELAQHSIRKLEFDCVCVRCGTENYTFPLM